MSSRALQMTVKSPDFATSLLWALNAKRLIGRRVADRMKEMGFNDEALAHEAHLTVKTVWRLRNGKSYPRAETAKRLAAGLGVGCLHISGGFIGVAEIRVHVAGLLSIVTLGLWLIVWLIVAISSGESRVVITG